MKVTANNKDSVDELNKIIDKYCEGNYLIGKTAKEEMAKDYFDKANKRLEPYRKQQTLF